MTENGKQDSASKDLSEILRGQKQPKQINNINTIILNDKNKIIYIPAYMRLLFKDIKQIDFKMMEAQINANICLDIYLEGLPKEMIQFVRDNIFLEFNRDATVQLSEKEKCKIKEIKQPKKIMDEMKKPMREFQKSQNKKKQFEEQATIQGLKKNTEVVLEQQKKGQKKDQKFFFGYNYIFRRLIKTSVDSYMFFTPIQVVDLILTIGVKQISFKDFRIRFNIMSRHESLSQGKMNIRKYLNFTESGGNYGNYQIATKRFDYQYSTERVHQTLMQRNKNIYNFKILDTKREQIKLDISKQQQEKLSYVKLKSVHYSHFHIPVYRSPDSFLTTIFIPLLLFSLILIAIYTLPPKLSNRIAAVSTLFLAFVALIPIIRQSLPPDPNLTFVQFLIYLEIVSTVLVLCQGFFYRTDDEAVLAQYLENYSLQNQPFMYFNLVITVLIFLVVIIMLIISHCFLQNTHSFNWNEIKDRKNDSSYENWYFSDYSGNFICDPKEQQQKKYYYRNNELPYLVTGQRQPDFYFYFGDENFVKYISEKCSQISSQSRVIKQSQLFKK